MMIITHFVLGFINSYLGFTPQSMLNLTASKIFLEKDKKAAYQFTLGASIVVFLQFFLSFLIVTSIHKFPNVLFWIKNISILLFGLISIYFLTKGISKNPEKKIREHKNNFIYGVSLSFINMFAIPFFAVTYSLLLSQGFINSLSSNILTFAFGIFFGTIGIFVSYVFLLKRFENKIIALTKFINPIIGIITGVFAIFSALKLYL